MPPLLAMDVVEAAMEGARDGVGDAERTGTSMPMSGVRLLDGSEMPIARGTWTWAGAAGLACGDARTSEVEESERCRAVGGTSKR